MGVNSAQNCWPGRKEQCENLRLGLLAGLLRKAKAKADRAFALALASFFQLLLYDTNLCI